MRIEFDAGSRDELNGVLALILTLRGDMPAADDSDDESGDDAEPLAVPAFDAAPPPAVAPVTAAPPPAVAPVTAAPPLPPPVAPAPSAAPVAGAVDRDADGLPWDNRIHSTPASKKKDGKWRGKRGLDDATREAVTAELRQAMAAPAPGAEVATPAIPLPPTPSEPVADAATAFAGGGATPVAETVPAPPPVAAVPAAPTAHAPFADLMRKVTGLQTAGQLTVAQTTEICQSLGLTGVRDLMHRADLIPSFEALLPVAG